MNALEKIAEKDKEGRELTKIEVAIYWVWNDTHTNMGIAYEAAEENAAMQVRIEKLEHLEVVAQDVNLWLKRCNMDGTAHQLSLEAALKDAA